MGNRRPGFQRVGARRTGQASSGGGGGSITQINGSSTINVAGGSGPTATISVPASTFDPLGAAAAAQAASQPLDSDLTAIAALSTTVYGRALLTLADQAALQAAAGLGTAAFQNVGAFDAAGAAAAAQAASQPLDSDLTAIAALGTTVYGRALLTLADQAALQAAAALGGDFNTYSTKATVCLNSTNLWTYFEDFVSSAAGSTVPLGWVNDAANFTTAMFNPSSTETGGIEYSTVSATANSRNNLYFKASLFSVGNKDFYLACKQRCTTALGTNQIFGMSVMDTSLVGNMFLMGFMNALNSANFIVGYGPGTVLTSGPTTAIDLGVAKDTAYHFWEIWTVGADLKARLDGGATFTAAGVAAAWGATKTAGLFSALYNGAAGAAMGRETSWVMARGVR